jgi:hypothetical protein
VLCIFFFWVILTCFAILNYFLSVLCLALPAGTPNLNFMSAMEAEHCARFDSNLLFTANNYKVTSTPKKEWHIVMKCDTTDADMSHGRQIPEISKLMQSEVAKISKLSDYEVVSVVLYTGPMVSFHVF